MKCELEYDNYRCLTLTAAAQLERHRRDSDAFRRFLLIARNHDAFNTTVAGFLAGKMPADDLSFLRDVEMPARRGHE